MHVAVKLPFSENLGHTEHACLLTKLHTFLASAWGFIVESTIHSKRQFIIFGLLAPHFSSWWFYLFHGKDRFDGEGGQERGIPGLCSPAFCTLLHLWHNIPGKKNPRQSGYMMGATFCSNDPVSVSGLVSPCRTENIKDASDHWLWLAVLTLVLSCGFLGGTAVPINVLRSFTPAAAHTRCLPHDCSSFH